MSAALAGGIAELIDTAVERGRTKNDIARLSLKNAAFERGIPLEDHRSNAAMRGILEVLSEVATRKDGTRDSTGQSGESPYAATGAGSAESSEAAEEAVSPVTVNNHYSPGSPGAIGQPAGGGANTDGGRSQVTATETGSGVGRTSLPWKSIAGWALAALAAGGSAGGLGSVVNWWLAGERNDSGAVVAPSDAEFPLGEWIEGNNWHLRNEN